MVYHNYRGGGTNDGAYIWVGVRQNNSYNGNFFIQKRKTTA